MPRDVERLLQSRFGGNLDILHDAITESAVMWRVCVECHGEVTSGASAIIQTFKAIAVFTTRQSAANKQWCSRCELPRDTPEGFTD